MLVVETIDDVHALVGKELGTSEWVEITQEQINDFARVSGDDNWIHVDVERVKRELPSGKTVAHGMLTFALVTHLGTTLFQIRQRSRGINYGSNKVRFITPVECGDRIRLHRTMLSAEPIEGGVQITYGNRMEIEGKPRPAMVAETISVFYGPRAA